MSLSQEVEDKLIWNLNRNGHYIVKSDNQHAMEALVNNEEYRTHGECMWKMWIT